MLRPTAGALAVTLLFAAACGDDTAPVRSQCRVNGTRLSLDGDVGPTELSVQEQEPFGGRAGETFITAFVEQGGDPHVLSFTSNTVLDNGLWEAIGEALRDNGGDAIDVAVLARTGTDPCDPRAGQICAVFGVDTNNDGFLLGGNEVIYPPFSGEARFTELTGNYVAGDFDITFAPLTSGVEEGGEIGGRLRGCFVLNRQADRTTLF